MCMYVDDLVYVHVRYVGIVVVSMYPHVHMYIYIYVYICIYYLNVHI